MYLDIWRHQFIRVLRTMILRTFECRVSFLMYYCYDNEQKKQAAALASRCYKPIN